MLFSRIVFSDSTECMNGLAKFNKVEFFMACSVGTDIDACKLAAFTTYRHEDVAMNELVAQKLKVSIF